MVMVVVAPMLSRQTAGWGLVLFCLLLCFLSSSPCSPFVSAMSVSTSNGTLVLSADEDIIFQVGATETSTSLTSLVASVSSVASSVVSAVAKEEADVSSALTTANANQVSAATALSAGLAALSTNMLGLISQLNASDLASASTLVSRIASTSASIATLNASTINMVSQTLSSALFATASAAGSLATASAQGLTALQLTQNQSSSTLVASLSNVASALVSSANQGSTGLAQAQNATASSIASIAGQLNSSNAALTSTLVVQAARIATTADALSALNTSTLNMVSQTLSAALFATASAAGSLATASAQGFASLQLAQNQSSSSMIPSLSNMATALVSSATQGSAGLAQAQSATQVSLSSLVASQSTASALLNASTNALSSALSSNSASTAVVLAATQATISAAQSTLASLSNAVQSVSQQASSAIANATASMQRSIQAINASVFSVQATADALAAGLASRLAIPSGLLPGDTAAVAGLSCGGLQATRNNYMPDGLYWINPDGQGAYQVLCRTFVGAQHALVLNLRTTDGNVLWWGNPLWQNSATYSALNPSNISAVYSRDFKSQAWNNLRDYNSIAIMVHTAGQYIGFRSFTALPGMSLLDFFSQACVASTSPGCNQMLGFTSLYSDVANINAREQLVRLSTHLFANHWWAPPGVYPDGDRLGSDESVSGSLYPLDNTGGGLGNWHDIPLGNLGSGITTVAGITLTTTSAFRTCGEASGGWCNYNGQNQGTFGTDTCAPMTCAQSDTPSTNAAWAYANGLNYDFAVFLGTSNFMPYGRHPSNPGQDCSDIYKRNGGAMQDGYFLINAMNTGAPFYVYCKVLAGTAWTMLLNLDTTDGHAMWWGDPLWQDANTYGRPLTPAYNFRGDHKSPAWMRLAGQTNLMLIVHTYGSVIGWKTWSRSAGRGPMGTMFSYFSVGNCVSLANTACNQVLADVVGQSNTSLLSTREQLVRITTGPLYANHIVSSNVADLDRIGSDQASPSDNVGGGLGNWHDAGYGDPGNAAITSVFGITYLKTNAYRTCSEAQGGWCNHNGQTQGTFGTDSCAPMTCLGLDTVRTNAAWAAANGVTYNYMLLGGRYL